MERKHGENVWQHMWDLMLNLIGTKTPGKKGLYEMQDTRYVRCACVWAIGQQHHQQACPVEANEPYSTWWPVVVSTNPAYISGGLMPVLCLPLLENSSRKPWLTHPDRITFVPDAVQTCTPSGATQPACLLSARTMEMKLWSPSTSPNEKAMELKEVGERLSGGAVGPAEWPIDLNSMD